MNFDGVEVQLVEVPGIIQEAAKGRGKINALLSVIGNADALIVMYSATSNVELKVIKTLLGEILTQKKFIIVRNKIDLAGGKEGEVNISIKDDIGIENLKESIWKLTDLMRIWTKGIAGVSKKATALKKGGRISDLIRKIHSSILEDFKYAKIWGPSAKFPGQRVGLEHVLKDGDVVRLFTNRKSY